jgi:NAD(P)H-hydrate epimerase
MEVIDAAQRFAAIGCGPGITVCTGSLAIVERLLSMNQVPRVMDADAINVIAHANLSRRLSSDVVLTPHPGELERLTGVSSKARSAQIDAAKSLAKVSGAVIVVKGGPTVVVSAEATWTNPTGNPGMATAGSGDVLTGIITSLLGQGLTTWDAARLGVWAHGLAGDIAAGQHSQPGMTCQEILDAVGHAVQKATDQADSVGQ